MSNAKHDIDNRTTGLAVSESGNEWYNQNDKAIFEKLMTFPPTGNTQSGSPGESEELSDTSALSYSVNDAKEFDRLMALLNPAKGLHRASPDRRNASITGTSYSDSDNNQFDELVSVFADRETAGRVGAVREADPKRHSIAYSDTDNRQFEQLLSGRAGLNADPPLPVETQDRQRASNTSHIKIIDFDKEHSRDRKSSREGRGHLKIRYFD